MCAAFFVSKVTREAVIKITIVFKMFRLERRNSHRVGGSMCSAAKNWPMEICSVYGISEMATTHDSVSDVLVEDRLEQIWVDVRCLGCII